MGRKSVGRNAGRRSEKLRPSTAWAAFALVLFALLPALGAPASSLPTPPNCVVSVDQALQTAHVSSVLADVLEFSGSVNVTTSTTNPRTLSILAEISPGDWATQVNPTSENVSDGEQVRFNATVAVPPATLSSARGTFTVRASFLAVPGAPGTKVECSQSSTIVVAQYYRLDIDTTEPRVELTAGPVGVECSIIVHNLGNGRDTFTLDLEDKLYLEDSKLHTNLPRRITLEADAETTMTFTINATGDAKAGLYDVAVVMKSDAQPQDANDNFVFTLTVKEGIIDQIIPDITGLAIIGAVLAGLVGVVSLRRHGRRKREALEAERKLKAVLRQRREAMAASGEAEGYAEDYGVEPQAEAPPPAPEPTAAEAQAPSADRVRVRVKAPPKA